MSKFKSIQSFHCCMGRMRFRISLLTSIVLMMLGSLLVGVNLHVQSVEYVKSDMDKTLGLPLDYRSLYSDVYRYRRYSAGWPFEMHDLGDHDFMVLIDIFSTQPLDDIELRESARLPEKPFVWRAEDFMNFAPTIYYRSIDLSGDRPAPASALELHLELQPLLLNVAIGVLLLVTTGAILELCLNKRSCFKQRSLQPARPC